VAFKNRYYAHLLPDDIIVWERFLSIHPNIYDRIEYDVRVGEGSTPPDDIEEKYKIMWRDLSQKRIDAIGHKPNLITIIEITRMAGMKAVGQLMVYPILYRGSYDKLTPISKLLIAEELLPDIESTLIENDIRFLLFPPGTGSPEQIRTEHAARGT